jgi:DNA-binding MarR family transcriptional regulator
MDEGKSVQDYADLAGVSKSVMSRHILDLGDRTRYMEEGLGLMYSRPNPNELRKHEVWLTPTGKALARDVLSLWTLSVKK